MCSAAVQPPSLAEFLQECRSALSYLKDYGFDEVPAPKHRSSNPFEVWFRADDRFIIVTGEGYGKVASVSL